MGAFPNSDRGLLVGEGGMTYLKNSLPSLSLDRGSFYVGLLLVSVAAFLGWNADTSLGFGPDQIAYNLVTEELLAAWDQDLPLETEFGSVWRQSFTVFHAIGQRLLGSPEASYRLILFLSAYAYLTTMYFLLASVLQDRAFAVLIAVLSIVQRYTIGTSFWGMGEYQAILPRIAVLAVFPLAWLLFERHVRSRRVLEAFVVVALGFALHLSAVYFYCILLSTYGLYVLWSRAWPSIWTLAVAFTFFGFAVKTIPSPVLTNLAASAPLLTTLVTLVGFGLVLCSSRLDRTPWMAVVTIACLAVAFDWLTGNSIQSVLGIGTSDAGGGANSPGSPTNGPDDLEAMNQALYARFGWTLFPISLATLGFALFNGGVLGAVALYEFVRRCRRGATDREILVGLYVVSVLIVSLGLTAGLQIYSRIMGRPDIVLELFRAFRFIHLPLYIYLGLFLQRVWRQALAERGTRDRLLCAALVVVLLWPPRQALAAMPDRLKLFVRSVAERSSSLHQGDPSQRQYLYDLLATDIERDQERIRHRDFVKLCHWVRHSTPEEAVFMTTDYDFIHYSGRDIMISYAQGAGSARSMAVVSGHRAWHAAYVAISGALASRSPDQIMTVARRYQVDYVVTAADQPALPLSTVYSNSSYSLYRLAP